MCPYRVSRLLIDQSDPESRIHARAPEYVRKANRRNRIHLDLTVIHAVTPPHRDTRTSPDTNATGDFPAANSLPEPLGECHEKRLLPTRFASADAILLVARVSRTLEGMEVHFNPDPKPGSLSAAQQSRALDETIQDIVARQLPHAQSTWPSHSAVTKPLAACGSAEAGSSTCNSASPSKESIAIAFPIRVASLPRQEKSAFEC